MIIFNHVQIEQINALNPLIESKFLYNSNRWNKLISEFKPYVVDFQDKVISRQTVIDSYTEYFSKCDDNIIRPFLLTMIWGFADTGYGTHRTNNYLASADNLAKIKFAIDNINNYNPESLEQAFKALKKINGLGVSYITKILYFATRAKGIDDYALIFDIRVASALVKLTAPSEIHKIINISPSSKFKDYKLYNDFIHNIAHEISVDAEQIEMYLFNYVD